MELLDYAAEIGQELEAMPNCEELGIVANWYARFTNCELLTRGGGCLTINFGSGVTAEEALAEYAAEIAGETIIFHSHDSEKRLEFRAPEDLKHTPGYRRPAAPTPAA